MKSRLPVVLGVFLLLALVPVFTQTSEEELRLGVAAYKDSHYEEAIQHFEKAAELDPNNIQAHLYLATTLTSQYIPGVDTPDNISEADHAIAEYQRVLGLDASNDQRVSSCKGIAYLYLNMKRWEDARVFETEADPSKPNACRIPDKLPSITL